MVLYACVAQVGLEGLGSPLYLDVIPRKVIVPGSLTPGATFTRTIVLENPTSAPANYSIEGE